LRLLRHEYGWHELARLHEVYIRLGNASDDLSFGQHEDHQGLVPDLTQDRSMDRQHMGSPLARAMGLGSAKEGAEHWWMQRVSAVALVPLTLWFVASIIAHIGNDYPTFIAWLRTPLASVSMILLLVVLFYRTALGLKVVIEDYVHSGAKFLAPMQCALAASPSAWQEWSPSCASPLAAESEQAHSTKLTIKLAAGGSLCRHRVGAASTRKCFRHGIP
jgi:succinate dehydrogenase / fumarate reductase membrane anchor subunit